MRPTTSILGVALIAGLMALSSNGLIHQDPHAPASTSFVAESVQSALVTGQVTILPNGTVTPSSAPVLRVGSIYTLTSGFSGELLIERNGSTLNGAGFTLTTTPGGTRAVVVQGADGVTVKGLHVANDTFQGFVVLSSSSVAIVSDTANGSGLAVDATSVSGLNISNDRFSNTSGIYLAYGSGLVIGSDDLTHTTTGVFVTNFKGIQIRNDNVSYGTSTEIEIEYSSNILATRNTLFNTPTFRMDVFYFYYDSSSIINWNNGSSGQYFVYGEYDSSTSITNNRFPGALYNGVFVDYGTNVTVEGNVLSSDGYYGIYLEYISDYSITYNQADHAGGYAIYTQYGTNGIIAHNNISFFRNAGINPEYSGNLSIVSNEASYSTSSNGDGIYTYQDSQVLLASNTATFDGDGWYDYESVGMVVNGNDFSNTIARGDGIYLSYDGGISIQNTQASNTLYGLYAYYSIGLSVRNSSFDRSGLEGLYVYGSSNVVLEGIDANSSVYAALDAEYSTHLVVTNFWGTLSRNYSLYLYEDQDVMISASDEIRSGYGVYAWFDTNLTVIGTNLSQDQYGLDLYYAAGAVISANSFWLDNYSFEYTGDNAGVLYHNNFVNDKGWLIVAVPTTAFAWADGYPVGGNYWSNYSGVDVRSGPGQNQTGSDRIGDTPFLINNVTSDPYPLMKAWQSHTITFTETGLPSGVGWTASVDGGSQTTRSNALVFVEGDGATAAFTYSISPVPGFRVSPSSGGGSESGTNVAVALAFTPVNYTVTFSVSGLLATTVWAVTIDGLTTTATGRSLTVNEPNGTFTYTVGRGTDYSITPSPGSFTVSGAPLTVTLTATEVVFNLTFSESGLSSGTSWSVTVNGVTKSSTGPSIVFQEPNGTYSFSVGAVGGYSVTPSKGTVSVTGGAAVFSTAFVNTGLSGTTLALSVGLVLLLVVAIAGWGMYILRTRRSKPPGSMTSTQPMATPALGEPPRSEGAPTPSSPPTPPSG